MDAQYHDVLKFFGIPLVGGADDGGVGLSFGAFGQLGVAIGSVQLFTKPVDTIYVDELLPFITYKFKEVTTGPTKGSYDLIVGNVLTAFLDATEALIGSNSGLSAKLPNFMGVQTIKNYIPAGGPAAGIFAVVYRGSDALNLAAHNIAGKLGMVFKKTNPIAAILSLLPQGAITFGLQLAYNGQPLIDATLNASAVAARYAKAAAWSTGADPLVLDLSGSGLATTYLDNSGVHFDLNNDFFSERTGWIAGDAGFLVLDENGNGRVDDATEMFGTFTGSGFADLATYDGNGDGIIDINDAVFTRLQVWVDGNANGVTDAGELKSLADLSITSFSLNATQIDGTTVQGSELRAAATYTLADGTSRIVYEAIFPTDQTDTIYRGESGQPAWVREAAGATVIDAKGFGRVTPLATATANDLDLADLVAATAAQMRLAA